MHKITSLILLLAAIFLAAGCTTTSQPTISEDPSATAELLGRWEGHLDVYGSSYDLVVRFEEDGDQLQGWIDIPGQGVTGLELSNIQAGPEGVRFEMKSNLPTSVFESPGIEDETLAGDYRMLGYKGAFDLHRSTAASAAAAPTQAPQEPLPYTEEEIRVQNGDVLLAGTLTLPEGDGPHPALILISGSGQQDRDSAHPAMPGYQPFRWIADHLARNGIAVLRYDDRGIGGSVGGESGVDTTYDYSTDTEAIFDHLRQHPRLNPDQIGLLGHSEGGHIAALVASRRPEVAFAINLAGTAVSGADLLMLQTELINRADGLPEEEVQRMLDSNREEVDLILAKDWEGLEEFLYVAVRKFYMDMPADQRVPDDQLEEAIEQTVAYSLKNNQGWVHYFLASNPANDWEKVQAPVLGLYGGLDMQVYPDQNATALEEALARGGNPDATVLVFPTANHLFQEAQTGGGEEYSQLPMQFVDGLLETLTGWITARTNIQ